MVTTAAGWVLILFAHVGVLGDGNSNALTTAGPFASKAACEQAGAAAKRLSKSTVKEISYTCESLQ